MNYHSYNKSQRDALLLSFILIKNSTRFGHIYFPSSAPVGVCHASYFDCLVARSGPS